jgi:hypothetical protein
MLQLIWYYAAKDETDTASSLFAEHDPLLYTDASCTLLEFLIATLLMLGLQKRESMLLKDY